MNKIKNIPLLLLIVSSCVSYQTMTDENMQEEVYEISEHFFLSRLKSIKKDKLWVNTTTENKPGLGLFKKNPRLYFGKMPIESHIKDSIFRKEILTKKNIDYFKEQFTLNKNGYKLVSKKLVANPKIGIIPDGAGLEFWHNKDLRYITSIMFSKDRKYALFYVSIPESTMALWVYKKENGKWMYYKAFHVSIS